MRHIDLKLGYACNNNCIHCVITQQIKASIDKRGNFNLSTKEVLTELNKYKKKGFDSITLTGGEALIRKDIFIIINSAHKKGFKINLQTNGRKLSNLDVVHKLLNYKITYIIALHGHNARIHDSISRSTKSFNETVEGIKNLVKYKQEVIGKVVLSKKNYKKLTDLVKFYIKLGVKNIAIAFPHANGNAWKYFDEVVPTYTQVKNYVHKTIQYVEAYNKKAEKSQLVSLMFEAMPFCFMKGYALYVEEFKQKGIKAEFKQLDFECSKDWEKSRLDAKKRFVQCKKCKFDKICEGVWAEYPEKYGSSEFKPIT